MARNILFSSMKKVERTADVSLAPAQIQKDVIQGLSWDPSINHELIGVSASNGVVTLSGSVPSYFEKTEAEIVAQRIGGVKAVIQDIEVKLGSSYFKVVGLNSKVKLFGVTKRLPPKIVLKI
jgi:hypothetical protein